MDKTLKTAVTELVTCNFTIWQCIGVVPLCTYVYTILALVLSVFMIICM